MAIPSIEQADVRGKKVLIRVDFNVPWKNSQVFDDSRIRASLPTIRSVLDRGGSVILASHLGRPKGAVVEEMRLAPAGARLSELLEQQVVQATDVTGPSARSLADRLEPGEILLLENLRFDPREEENDPSLAKELAELADIYVNDAFGAAHRAHASTTGVATFAPAYIGLLMQKELNNLSVLTENPARPFVAVLGGAKVTDKVGVIEQLIQQVDVLLLGGGMANTFALASGYEIGKSLADRDFVEHAQTILDKARDRKVAIHLPVDVVVARDIHGQGRVVGADEVPSDASIFDIGPETVTEYGGMLSSARTVFWNGPMGVFENPEFANGTLGIARAIAVSDAFSVIGGGDSLAAIEQSGVADQIDHLSTGGGASLEFLEGAILPGVAALNQAEIS